MLSLVHGSSWDPLRTHQAPSSPRRAPGRRTARGTVPPAASEAPEGRTPTPPGSEPAGWRLAGRSPPRSAAAGPGRVAARRGRGPSRFSCRVRELRRRRREPGRRSGSGGGPRCRYRGRAGRPRRACPPPPGGDGGDCPAHTLRQGRRCGRWERSRGPRCPEAKREGTRPGLRVPQGGRAGDRPRPAPASPPPKLAVLAAAGAGRPGSALR